MGPSDFGAPAVDLIRLPLGYDSCEMDEGRPLSLRDVYGLTSSHRCS